MQTEDTPAPRLRHPGPRGWPRVKTQRSRVVGTMEALYPGEPLTAELIRITAALGVGGGYAEVFSGTLTPVHYCVPDAGDERRLVSYSPTRIRGSAGLLYGSATIGTRDGEPFVHGHFSWLEPDGLIRGGHIWPETRIGDPAPVAAVFGLLDAGWISADDPETGMPAFEPHPVQRKDRVMDDSLTTATVARVLPNEDITDAVLEACRAAGYDKAVVRAGLGSLIGARFRDHRTGDIREVDGPGTEVISLTGFVIREDDRLHATLTCTLVDRHGDVHTGVLVPGANPVAVTFEIAVQPAR